ncbi:DExH-box ATP-dependent RNA helicase DExH17 isoform X2 [Lycium ferocissimum]|uniref:DExH-box ATP-dependent RNA helicase DExH17 isoform X2 n=1 Tax=Lycium ferocissimum TaxID=112874 RepID=UPI00281627CA|nr:DExH-box ATP-dependent RNA helicase DExH17 isoform X2 [Lycium ferocissimum]
MDGFALKSVLDLPPVFRSTFSFRYFNSLQSECFPACFLSDVNMVISAPTGSGKTVLFELCILRLLSRFISREGKFIHVKGSLKTIYVAPSKALVQEKLRNWNQKLGSWGINCLELTGDNEYYKISDIQDADVILTTPEKFDAVTRYRIKDGGLSFFGDIALVLIDEVHLLNDPRGAALEAIVSRIKMLSRKTELKSSALANVRFLAVSATIPNIDDLEWLMVPRQGVKRFGEEMRPVKLTTKVFGYTPAKNDFLFEKRLQNYVFDILMQHSRGKSALVFCSTRKGAQEAAQQLSQTAMTFGHSNPFIKSREQQERLREASLSCSDKQMQSYIPFGVGYHNGGLSMNDRNLIEGLFLNGDIQVLCTTNTLAHGINLPAHTVVIKSTQYFNKEKGIYMEYDRSTVLQMSGRAGRPPFDDTGMVVIMTRKETVHLYENLLSGCELVESQLLPCVTEHLTAEIVQLTVSDITGAIEWMKCSYLYVRIKKNPEKYGVKKGLTGDRLERHMQDICVQNVNELSRYQLIWTDEDGFLLKPLEPGKLMTKYYLKFDTMKHIMQAPGNCSIENALQIICRAEELAWIQLRRNEKKLLNDINIDKDNRLRFHIIGDKGKRKKRVQTREEKIFVLANDCLTGDPLVHDLSLNQDMNSICANGYRIAKCMKEYFVYRKNYRGALSSALLTKSLYQKVWDDSPYVLKQLPGIGMVTAKALHSMGVKSFVSLSEADPRKIEMVTGRKYPFGNHIKESLLSLPPEVEMRFEEIERQRQGKSKVMVTLTRLSQPVQTTKRHYADMVVGIEEDNLVLFHEKIRVDDFPSPYSKTVMVPSPQQGKLTVKADLIFNEFIGVDLHQKILLIKEMDHNFVMKYRTKQPSSFQNNDVCIIEDTEDAVQASCQVSHSLTEADRSSDMPSFKLIDEDLDEAIPAAAIEDDECRIINEKTIFDHIREKAKNLPALTSLRGTCSPSLETLNLIRKRTREKQRLVENEVGVYEEVRRTKVPCHSMDIQSAEYIDLEDNRPLSNKDERPYSHHVSNAIYLASDTGNFSFETGSVPSETMAEEMIFEYKPMDSKIFHSFENVKNTEPKLLSMSNETFIIHQPQHNSAIFGFQETTTTKVAENAAVTMDLEPVKTKGNAIKQIKEVEDLTLHGYTRGTGEKTDLSLETSRKDAEEGSRLLSPADAYFIMNKVGYPLRSPSFQEQQCTSSVQVGEINQANSFLGFKSIFTFLFE